MITVPFTTLPPEYADDAAAAAGGPRGERRLSHRIGAEGEGVMKSIPMILAIALSGCASVFDYPAQWGIPALDDLVLAEELALGSIPAPSGQCVKYAMRVRELLPGGDIIVLDKASWPVPHAVYCRAGWCADSNYPGQPIERDDLSMRYFGAVERRK